MKLKSITVGGFKNLQKTRIELQNIISIISPNNYGKSNLLEAIDFGVGFISAGEKSRKQMMGWTKGIPINKAIENEDFFFEIEFINDSDDSNDSYKYVKYGFSFSWYRDNGSGQRITDEWLEARPKESRKFTSFLKRKEGKYRKEKGTNFRNISLSNLQLSIDVLNVLDDIPIKPLIQTIRTIDFKICSSLDLGERFQPAPIEYYDETDTNSISFDDEDVPRAIHKLSQIDTEKYNLFLEAVYTLFPDFTDVSIKTYAVKTPPSHKVLSMMLSDEEKESPPKELDNIPFRIKEEIYRVFITNKYLNQPIDISRMSTGTKRVFWLLVNVFIASCQKVCFIGVEELETSIHPNLLRTLLEFLDEALEDTSLIISSHSPFLIQYIKSDKIYVGYPTTNGTALFKRIKPNKTKQLNDLARDNDMYLGEYIFELLSGDSDSKKLLSFYLEDNV